MSLTYLMIEGQAECLVLLAVLIGALFGCSYMDGFTDGSFLGLSTTAWVVLSVAVPVLHQLYVWACWRSELHLHMLSTLLRRAAFPLYVTGFMIFLLARPAVLIGLALANQGTLALAEMPARGVSLIMAAAGIYVGYSTLRYLGLSRAAGLDHFDPEIRRRSLVRAGAFRHSSNAIYKFGFLALYFPGLWFGSTAAVVLALFSHVYIWVHYFFIEKPDMENIYGPYSLKLAQQ